MSSLTNDWPTYAVYILLGLLLITIGLFFFKSITEVFKALGRMVKEVVLLFSWTGLGFATLILIGGSTFYVLYKDPFHLKGNIRGKNSVERKTAAKTVAPTRSAPEKTVTKAVLHGYRPPLCQELKGAEGRVFDYYCPRGSLRVWAAFNRIDPVLAEYVVMLEDDKFYQHGGLDADGIFNALEKDIKAGKFVSGGSTITQQLAKNLFLTKEKSIMRKLEEVPIALRLEKELSKKQILELYLNTIEWGPGVYGIEAACRLYFDHDASQLTEPERWLMALIIPNPKELNLWVQPRGRKSLLKRAARFSQRLKYEKHISEAERKLQFQVFLDFLEQWVAKKPKSTWIESRRYPASWSHSLSISSIPTLWHGMTASPKNASRALALDWALQSRLNALLPVTARPSAPFGRSHRVVLLVQKNGLTAGKSIRAVGPWPLGTTPGAAFADLARESQTELEVLAVTALSQDWFFAK